jgi:hypothetical protein
VAFALEINPKNKKIDKALPGWLNHSPENEHAVRALLPGCNRENSSKNPRVGSFDGTRAAFQ